MYIALHHSSGIVGSLIRWQTRGYYSHASIVLDSGAVIESREFIGVRQLPRLEPKKGEVIDLYAFDHTAEQAAAIEEFLKKQIGKPYDYPMVVGFVSRARAEGHESAGKYFCSELAFAGPQKAAGIAFLNRREAWEVAPEHLGWSPLLKFERRIQG